MSQYYIDIFTKEASIGSTLRGAFNAAKTKVKPVVDPAVDFAKKYTPEEIQRPIRENPRTAAGIAGIGGGAAGSMLVSKNNNRTRRRILQERAAAEQLKKADPGTTNWLTGTPAKAALTIGVPSLALLLLAGALKQ